LLVTIVPHPLDRPIWTALTTRQRPISIGGDLARRFAPDVSPLCAIAEPSPAALAALAALLAPGDDLSLLEQAPQPGPEGVTLQMSAPCVQMIAKTFTGEAGAFSLEALGDDDAAEMLALAELTKPGPFRIATHRLGRFLGIRDGARLVAMAGERLHLDGFIEISAVCTHPDYRSRGYGAALMRAVGARIIAEGETPFLHTYAANAGAIALYRTLGFELRHELIHSVWTRP
jgi:predicted GNAT family acetyltransferase